MSPTVLPDDTLPLWQQVCHTKREEREACISQAWKLGPGIVQSDLADVTQVSAQSGILTSRELKITETPADRLVQSLIKRQYSCYEVFTPTRISHCAMRMITTC